MTTATKSMSNPVTQPTSRSRSATRFSNSFTLRCSKLSAIMDAPDPRAESINAETCSDQLNLTQRLTYPQSAVRDVGPGATMTLNKPCDIGTMRPFPKNVGEKFRAYCGGFHQWRRPCATFFAHGTFGLYLRLLLWRLFS